ncbi:hypothetical protein LMH87_001212 [Akanthomyces muscarius]|uniref:Oxidoreductase n=1 Tax=Akanthomyces muscarius TaxID=2231603 RepID=A0A9W8QGM0_AKAMU|nr:hypothetical protein LMH87_001212 [Akanthomyces muscarius]KAJ4155995.1 hypothetical protein LMH87_001212 [Akanthomyces muscarius]
MGLIRVGLIGLGPVRSEGYRPGEWGIQHMDAINNSPHFELVAVANSSVASAQRSIDAHKLPATVKAYGSPQDIAADPNVDLISVAVNINRHYELVKPALVAKKNVIVEFPFMPTVEQTEELIELANANDVKVFVAAQARADPAVLKLKEILASKVLGEIVHTQFTAQNAMGTPPMWPESTEGFFDISAGISRVNILLGHPLDALVSVLGGFKSVQSIFKTQVRTTNLVGNAGKVTKPNYKITAPDILTVQGIMNSGATAALSIRTCPLPADGVGFRWLITGTEGEAAFTAGPGVFQMNPTSAKITLKKGVADSEEIEFNQKEGNYYANMGPMGGNTMRFYEAVAKGDVGAYSTIEQTLETEKLMHELKKVAIIV